MYRPDLRSIKDTVPEEPEGIQHLNYNRLGIASCWLYILDSSSRNLPNVISVYLKGTGNNRVY